MRNWGSREWGAGSSPRRMGPGVERLAWVLQVKRVVVEVVEPKEGGGEEGERRTSRESELLVDLVPAPREISPRKRLEPLGNDFGLLVREQQPHVPLKHLRSSSADRKSVV